MFLHLFVSHSVHGRGAMMGVSTSGPGGGVSASGLGSVYLWFAKVKFSHLSVILFTGWCLPLVRGLYTPWADTPPLGRHPLSPSKHYGIWSTSGRYASYWNTFLYENFSEKSHKMAKFCRNPIKIIHKNAFQ